MKILAFGASYSIKSINKKFAAFAANQFGNAEVEIFDLREFILPLYIEDLEKEISVPELVKTFVTKIQSADLIIISLAEHNGNYTAAFKNLFDWDSVYNLKIFENKKLILHSTSNGALGAKFVLNAAINRFPRHGADIFFSFSLPNINKNFDDETGIKDKDLLDVFNVQLQFVKQKFILIREEYFLTKL